MTPPPSPPEDAPMTSPAAGGARPAAQTKGEAARHAYVTGLAATIAEAAAVAGITESHALALSSRDGWVEARKAHLERERAALASESAEGEARVQATTRRLAWRVAWKALLRVEARVDDPSKTITGYEAEAMVRAALALSGVGDLEADEAMQRLRRKPIREVAVQFVAVMRQYGVEVEDLGVVAAAPSVVESEGTSPAQQPESGGTPPP